MVHVANAMRRFLDYKVLLKGTVDRAVIYHPRLVELKEQGIR